ncbi:hypothetical protein SUGI_0746260 [Cryptomeria japonica]|nr:hypothetical protein SUGI_0746260 [Cryptomeria japonica]
MRTRCPFGGACKVVWQRQIDKAGIEIEMYRKETTLYLSDALAFTPEFVRLFICLSVPQPIRRCHEVQSFKDQQFGRNWRQFQIPALILYRDMAEALKGTGGVWSSLRV